MAQIEVRGLGANEIRIGRRRITPATEVVFALAFYLCVRSGERITRDEVVEVFWGTGDVTKGRHSLRQMLYKLRQRGFELDEDGEELCLGPSRLTSDVWEALQDSWSDEASVASLETSLDLVPALTKGVSPRFHEWLDGLRARLGAQHRRAAIRHLHQARREGRWSDLDRIALLMLRTDPLNEEATLARAESAAMIGSKALALEILDQYMEELGEKAPRIGLPATVLRRRIAERGGNWIGDSFREMPLVGRAGEMRALSSLFTEAAKGSAQRAFLVGAAGNGKTRLMAEFRAFAEMDGAQSVQVRADASANRRPLSLVLEFAERARELRGAAGCSPDAMAITNRILEFQDRSYIVAASQSDALSVEAVAWALASLVVAAAEERRTLLLIDDIHNADVASVELLSRVAAQATNARALWIASSRFHGSIGFSDLLKSWRETAVIEVPPLSLQSSAELASRMVSDAPGEGSLSLVSSLARQSGGNPFFLRELASHARHPQSPGPLPGNITSLLQRRIERMPQPDSQMLRVVLLLGGLASLERLARILGFSPLAVAGPTERLEDEGILRFGSNARIELHECWQQAIGASLRPATKAALALQCAECLVSDNESRSSVEEMRAAADLFAMAGEYVRACRTLADVAGTLDGRGLRAPALEAVEGAIALAPDSSSRCYALARRAMINHSASEFERAARDCEDALRGPLDAEMSGESRALLLGLWTDSLWRSNRPHDHALSLLAVAAASPKLQPSTRQLSCLLGIRSAFAGGNRSLTKHFHALSEEETLRSGTSVVGALCHLINCAENAEPAQVLEADAALQSLSFEPLPTHLKALVLRSRSNALRWIGANDAASRLIEESYQFALAAGSFADAKRTSIGGVHLALDTNDVEAAYEWLSRADAYSAFDTSGESVIALRHAQSRTFLQSEKYSDCVSVFGETLEAPMSDALRKRRAVVLSCPAFALAAIGRQSDSAELIDAIASAVSTESPNLQMDLPAELCFRTLAYLGRAKEGDDLLAGYARRRVATFDRFVQPFYKNLRKAVAAIPTRADTSRLASRVIDATRPS